MDNIKKKVSKKTIYFRNKIAKERINSVLNIADNIRSDNKKDVRKKQYLCKCCFYIDVNRVAGASFTTQPCGVCEKKMVFSSTATDVMCQECAEESNLCKRCGSDMDFLNRKKYEKIENDSKK